MKRFAVVSVLSLSLLSLPTAAFADDHLATAFQNGSPNLGNSNPFCVPGAGSPNVGQDLGTPSNSDGAVSCRQNGTVGTGKPLSLGSKVLSPSADSWT